MYETPANPIPGYKPVCTLKNSKFNFSFRIDPSDVQWGYHLEMDEQLTVGGMVKYIRGVVIDNVTVTVETGIGGLDELKRLANFVYDHMTHARITGEPLRFTNPSHPWDLEVFIRNVGGLHVDGVTKNYKITMEMSVIKNNLEMDVYEISSLIGGNVEGITNIAIVHTVKSGETLDDIAERYYGDVNLGKKIILDVNSNRVKVEGNYIKPGTEIVIPYMTRDTGYSVYVLQPTGDSQNVLHDPKGNLGSTSQRAITEGTRSKTGHGTWLEQ